MLKINDSDSFVKVFDKVSAKDKETCNEGGETLSDAAMLE